MNTYSCQTLPHPNPAGRAHLDLEIAHRDYEPRDRSAELQRRECLHRAELELCAPFHGWPRRFLNRVSGPWTWERRRLAGEWLCGDLERVGGEVSASTEGNLENECNTF